MRADARDNPSSAAAVRRFFKRTPWLSGGGESGKAPTNADYWSSHNVTNHQAFATREASLRRLNWRNSQYLFYADWLQCPRFEAKAVLDFGCGPGDDLVALQEFSKPDRLVGVDVSAASAEESKRRLACHAGKQPEIRLVDEGGALPFDAGSFDSVIASGVLRHVFDLGATLSELYRVLKPGGVLLAMIYNR